jgi:hypothetical protein
MASRKINLLIDQGSTYTNTLVLVDTFNQQIDYSGYSGQGQLRKYYTSSTAVSFAVNTDNAAAGEITLSLTAEQTSDIAAGRYVYDVELTNGDVVTRVLEGMATVTPEVTRI